MIRLQTVTVLDTPAIEILCDGVLVLSTASPEQFVARLTKIGVENPRPLVEAVQQWGTVHIDKKGDRDQAALAGRRIASADTPTA